MTNKKPTLAQQTYKKVCDLETMLKAHLDGKPPAPTADKQLFLAAAAPGEALAVIRLADAPNHLPCFDEADLLYGIPGLPILMSYCPAQVFYIDDEAYLTGPMIFFRIDRCCDMDHLADLEAFRFINFFQFKIDAVSLFIAHAQIGQQTDECVSFGNFDFMLNCLGGFLIINHFKKRADIVY